MQLKVEARGHNKAGKKRQQRTLPDEPPQPDQKKSKKRKNGGQGGGGEGGGQGGGMPGGQMVHLEVPGPKAAQATEGNGHIASMTIRAKESLRNFNRRVDNAARQKLHQDANRHTNTAAKKKDWNQAKKDRRKEKRGRKQEEDDERQADPFNQTDVVEFGEVAMTPTSF